MTFQHRGRHLEWYREISFPSESLSSIPMWKCAGKLVDACVIHSISCKYCKGILCMLQPWHCLLCVGFDMKKEFWYNSWFRMLLHSFKCISHAVAALKKYHDVNGKLPERIIVFRDDVGDGQLDVVYDHEMPQLFKSFQQIGAEYKWVDWKVHFFWSVVHPFILFNMHCCSYVRSLISLQL